MALGAFYAVMKGELQKGDKKLKEADKDATEGAEKIENEEDKKQFLLIADIYKDFKGSEFYANLSKNDRAKYTKKYIIEYIENNIFFRKYYAERYNNFRNIVKGWRNKNIE